MALGRLAKRLGAERFCVVSSMGADSRSRSFYLRVKGEMEETLRGMDLQRLCIFRPALLTGERQEYRRGEELIKKVLKPIGSLLVGPLRKYRPVSAEQVAESMCRVALGEREHLRVVESDAIQALSS